MAVDVWPSLPLELLHVPERRTSLVYVQPSQRMKPKPPEEGARQAIVDTHRHGELLVPSLSQLLRHLHDQARSQARPARRRPDDDRQELRSAGPVFLQMTDDIEHPPCHPRPDQPPGDQNPCSNRLLTKELFPKGSGGLRACSKADDIPSVVSGQHDTGRGGDHGPVQPSQEAGAKRGQKCIPQPFLVQLGDLGDVFGTSRTHHCIGLAFSRLFSIHPCAFSVASLSWQLPHELRFTFALLDATPSLLVEKAEHCWGEYHDPL